MTPDSAERYRRIATVLAEAPPGMHRLEPGPAPSLALGELPPALAELYSQYNGGELFFELLELREIDDVETDGERWLIADCGRDCFAVDRAGAVWRFEGDTGEVLPEGTRVDRWLDGFLFAESLLFDDDGEFADDIVGDDGELTAEVIVERERRALRRDKQAIAPRWRMARALVATGRLEAARGELEEVVARAPDFAWAWFDLARAAEKLGDVDGAIEDAREAADCRDGNEQAPFFLAFAARVAADAGDDARRASLAARAAALDPNLVASQREGAIATLADGDLDAAEQLVKIGLAVQPRSLELLALARQITAARADSGPADDDGPDAGDDRVH